VTGASNSTATPEEDINDIADQVVHVHLKDKLGGQMEYNFPPLGEGNINFRPVISALRDSGYLGPYSVEIEVEGERSAQQEDALRKKLYTFAEKLVSEA